MSSAGAIRAARQQEEEQLTRYSAEELAQGWEFKILRSNTGAFGRPGILKQVCEEEARCGWILVEIFDNSRIRFKRPVSARDLDSHGQNPYRTTYGMSTTMLVVLILIGSLIFTLLLTAAGLKLGNRSVSPQVSRAPSAAWPDR